MTSAQRRAFRDIKRAAKKTAKRDGGSAKPAVRAREVKAKAVAYKGGCCSVCGYDRCLRALEFHHVDPSSKDFTISNMTATWRWDMIQAELDKCVLLCANCHREEHERLNKSNG